MFLTHWPSHVRPPRSAADLLFSSFNVNYRPFVSVQESAEGWELVADVPGCSVEDVKIDLVGDTLTLTAERPEPARAGAERIRHERARGAWSQSFRLLRPVDTEKVEAIVKDGVLTIKLPRAAAPATRTIPVSVA